MKHILLLIFFCFSVTLSAQSPEALLEQNSFSVAELTAPSFIDFFRPSIATSQFIFVGEQHGIVEAGEVTNAVFRIGRPYGYETLCIETDSLAARSLEGFYHTGNMLEAARNFDRRFPFSIPFYNNEEDYHMFNEVLKGGGHIWGIDQSLMSQFRMNFTLLAEQTKSKHLRETLAPLIKQATDAYEVTIKEKDFTAPYIFQYDQETHQSLLDLATVAGERAVIDDLWKSKDIYAYNFSQQYYLNNEVRGRLMKHNFMSYYRQESQEVANPRVVFKLGANHAAKGLTRTRIYDIANLGAELAIANGMESLHLAVMGVSGTQNRATPFTPDATAAPIDVAGMLPALLVQAAQDAPEKYYVLQTAALRPQSRKFDTDIQDLLFAYDVLILIKGARAVTGF